MIWYQNIYTRMFVFPLPSTWMVGCFFWEARLVTTQLDRKTEYSMMIFWMMNTHITRCLTTGIDNLEAFMYVLWSTYSLLLGCHESIHDTAVVLVLVVVVVRRLLLWINQVLLVSTNNHINVQWLYYAYLYNVYSDLIMHDDQDRPVLGLVGSLLNNCFFQKGTTDTHSLSIHII